MDTTTRERSVSNRLFGYHVDKYRFWLIFTLMLVFFTSPAAHLPFLFGYGELASVATGLAATVLNVLIPFWAARRAWLTGEPGPSNDGGSYPPP